MPRLTALLLTLLLTAACRFGFDPPERFDGELNPPPGEFIRTFYLCGPLPAPPAHSDAATSLTRALMTDYLATSGGEAGLRQVSIGDTVNYQGRSHRWFMHLSGPPRVDLARWLPDEPGAVGYALGRVYSRKGGTWTLRAGSDGPLRVWVNGRLTLHTPANTPYVEGSQIVPVQLQPGRNHILVKVVRGRDPWGFSLRFTR